MKNIADWTPSKYVLKKGKLHATKATQELNLASRLIAAQTAAFYSDVLGVHAKGRLLDLGCGKVPLYEGYKKYVDEVICVDWENTRHTTSFLDFTCDLNQDLFFAENESFDTLILSDVLEHIKEPTRLIREAFRVLRKDGKIIMNVPFFYWIHEAPHDYFRYTEYALRELFEENGFEILELRSLGGALDVLADITAKISLTYFPFGKTIAKMTQSITLFLGRTGIGGKLRSYTKEAFPLSYGLILYKPTQKKEKI